MTRTRPTDNRKPSRDGKLKGYCSRCGMMVMVGEATCPKPLCGGKKVSSTPPPESGMLAPKQSNIRNYI